MIDSWTLDWTAFYLQAASTGAPHHEAELVADEAMEDGEVPPRRWRQAAEDQADEVAFGDVNV